MYLAFVICFFYIRFITVSTCVAKKEAATVNQQSRGHMLMCFHFRDGKN